MLWCHWQTWMEQVEYSLLSKLYHWILSKIGDFLPSKLKPPQLYYLTTSEQSWTTPAHWAWAYESNKIYLAFKVKRAQLLLVSTECLLSELWFFWAWIFRFCFYICATLKYYFIASRLIVVPLPSSVSINVCHLCFWSLLTSGAMFKILDLLRFESRHWQLQGVCLSTMSPLPLTG